MENKMIAPNTIEVLESKIAELLEEARSQVVKNINTTMVYTNFEIGRFGKGYSEDNLSNMRKFYLCYQGEQFSETLSRKFTLSWSHYLKLIRIQNADERKFYDLVFYNRLLRAFVLIDLNRNRVRLSARKTRGESLPLRAHFVGRYPFCGLKRRPQRPPDCHTDGQVS